MSQDNQRERSNNQQKKKTRRTRKDQQGRDFTCPCGKSYLSYPALYTHIKTKHQGKTPKEQGNGIIAKVEMQEQGDTKDPLDSIQESVEKYFPGDCKENYAVKFQQSETALVDNLQQQWKVRQNQIANNPTIVPNTNINCIFGHFLTQMKPRLKAQSFLYLNEFIICFHKGLIKEKNNQNYCQQNTGSHLPHTFNQLIINNRIPSSVHTRKGSPLSNMTLACKIFYYFGSWLFNQRYTNFQVKFNSTQN